MTRTMWKWGSPWIASLAIGLMALPLVAQEQRGQDATGRQQRRGQQAQQEAANQNIPQALREAGQFETLSRAIQTADLQQTLEGRGPFTLFAPTDEAFEKLPSEKREALMQDREQLRSVLLNHVVSGEVSAERLPQVQSATTAEGKRLSIQGTEDRVTIDGKAQVRPQQKIRARNGIIFPVDTVLMPEQDRMQPGQQQRGQQQRDQQQRDPQQRGQQQPEAQRVQLQQPGTQPGVQPGVPPTQPGVPPGQPYIQPGPGAQPGPPAVDPRDPRARELEQQRQREREERRRAQQMEEDDNDDDNNQRERDQRQRDQQLGRPGQTQRQPGN